jgi:outer membrane biosynthesis protein TonB
MRQSLAIALIAIAIAGVSPDHGSAQEQHAESVRKVLNRVTPGYPDLAKRMNVAGTVRLIAVVAPNGSLVRTEVLGGSPLLVQAAQNALNKWKWATATEETKEIVEMRFHPE